MREGRGTTEKLGRALMMCYVRSSLVITCHLSTPLGHPEGVQATQNARSGVIHSFGAERTTGLITPGDQQSSRATKPSD